MINRLPAPKRLVREIKQLVERVNRFAEQAAAQAARAAENHALAQAIEQEHPDICPWQPMRLRHRPPQPPRRGQAPSPVASSSTTHRGSRMATL